MTTDIDRAADVIAPYVAHFLDAKHAAQALAADGLLTPEPRVITREKVARELARQAGTHHLDLFEMGVESFRNLYLERADAVIALLNEEDEDDGPASGI